MPRHLAGLLLTTQRTGLSRAGAEAQAKGVDRGVGGGMLGAPVHSLPPEPHIVPVTVEAWRVFMGKG